MLNEAGMRSSSEAEVTKSRIALYLSDPFYIGKIRWNDQLYSGNQETFINHEIFSKVQTILKGKTTPKYRKHSYLFQGLIHCAECNGLITWENQKDHLYGHCNHYRGCTQSVWFKEQDVEQQILSVFGALQIKNNRIAEWIRKAIKESHKDEMEYYSTSINEFNHRLEAIEQRFGRIYDDKIDGKIAEEFYQKKLKQYSQEKDQVQQALGKHSNANAKYYELATNIYDLSQKAKEIYLKAKDKENKRQLFKLIFATLTVDAGTLSYTFTKAFQLLSEAVAITNGSNVDKTLPITARIFEPMEKTDTTEQIGGLVPTCPTWLPRLDSNQRHPP